MLDPPLQGKWEFPWTLDQGVGSYITRDGRLPCLGWAIADPDLPTIEIHVDGGLFERVAPSQHREDVEIALGHSSAAAAGPTGWACALDVRPWRPGPHHISAIARTNRAEVSLGTRVVEMPDGLPDLDRFWLDLSALLQSPVTGQRLSYDRLSLRTQDGATYPVKGHQLFFSSTPGAWLRQATSSWGFSAFAREVLQTPHGWVLAIGAGIGPTAPRLIQLDIVDFPNVDVVWEGERLPFVDASLDAVICENVIEHVRDPFGLVAEINRVLKPAGQLGLNGTNMHFTHGYPSHFFNATEFGMRDLLETRSHFEGKYEFISGPESIRTVLAFYVGALPPDVRRQVERLTVADLLEPSHEVRGLLASVPDRVRRAVSTNIYFSGRKKA